jgi:hypothetical protein
MGRFGKGMFVGLFILSLYGCGNLLTKIRPQQSIPTDRYFSIANYDLNDKQQLFVTLHDFSDVPICENYRVEPDSIVCYIDSFLTTPTLLVNKIYIEQTEYRFNNQPSHHKGSNPPDNADPNGRFATINYRIPVLVYRFSFPNLQLYESMIPEKIRSKTRVRYPPSPQLLFE